MLFAEGTSRYQTDVTDEEWLVIIPHLAESKVTVPPRPPSGQLPGPLDTFAEGPGFEKQIRASWPCGPLAARSSPIQRLSDV